MPENTTSSLKPLSCLTKPVSSWIAPKNKKEKDGTSSSLTIVPKGKVSGYPILLKRSCRSKKIVSLWVSISITLCWWMGLSLIWEFMLELLAGILWGYICTKTDSPDSQPHLIPSIYHPKKISLLIWLTILWINLLIILKPMMIKINARVISGLITLWGNI